MSDFEQFSYCPTLREILRTQTVMGRSGPRTDLGSFSTVNNLTLLRNMLLAEKPQRTLEIGMAFGGSALVFTSTHSELGNPEKCHIAIDPFQTEAWDDAGELAVEKAGLTPYLDLRRSPSQLALADMLNDAQAETLDFVYVDGSHLFEDVFVDWYFVAQLLAPNGLVAFDDSTDPHVRKMLRFVRRNFGGSFQEVDTAPYRPSGWKTKARNRVAQWLGKSQITLFRKVGPAQREWNAPFHSF